MGRSFRLVVLSAHYRTPIPRVCSKTYCWDFRHAFFGSVAEPCCVRLRHRAKGASHAGQTSQNATGRRAEESARGCFPSRATTSGSEAGMHPAHVLRVSGQAAFRVGGPAPIACKAVKTHCVTRRTSRQRCWLAIGRVNGCHRPSDASRSAQMLAADVQSEGRSGHARGNSTTSTLRNAGGNLYSHHQPINGRSVTRKGGHTLGTLGAKICTLL